jgi:5-methyltetrahydrofolate--homocysteine methyltransferase
VLNSVFLYHNVQAGLDLAIVNAEKLERYASIPDEEIQLCVNLFHNTGDDPVAEFAAHFRDRAPTGAVDKTLLPLDERLGQYILEGTRDGLVADLNEALKESRPLEIINGPLMAGMDEVGRLFNANQLIVAEVLQSAESMKTAVAHLEQFMEKGDSSDRGKVILATVKGDVHDIGQNLVEIILSNNGFSVVNLGIKVHPEPLIQAANENKPDIIGLSGLLVKSAQQMITTASDFTQAGITTPVLVGGAALSEKFVLNRIGPEYAGAAIYAKDAMHGLDLAKRIIDPETFETLKAELTARAEEFAADSVAAPVKPVSVSKTRCPEVDIISTPIPAPDFDRHVIRNTALSLIWTYINPLMLYTRHLGVKGKVARQFVDAEKDPGARRTLAEAEPKAVEIWEAVQDLMTHYADSDIFKPKAVYQFFKAYSNGNTLHLHHSERNAHFEFPRQPDAEDGTPGLCLSDYVNPDKAAGDAVALFVVTAGEGVMELPQTFKENGEFLKSHIIQALALETAEGYAEYIHQQIRAAWGNPDPVDMTMTMRFQAKYSGKRYSFGYPACPNLDDQGPLFDLLQPADIGVELTEGFMMEPEASVSAICFNHPQARYFAVERNKD